MAKIAGMIILLVAAALSATPAPAVETEAERAAALCERAVLTGARRGGVPAETLHAIALAETGRNLGGRMRPWPWAINREGEGHWFATRDEALAFAKASAAAGRRSFDVGCFQINFNWHGQAFSSLEAMFDMDTSATYAAQFLRSLHAELGDWSKAAGAYHSRTPEFNQRYRARFDRILADLGGAPLLVAAAPAPEAEDEAPRRARKPIRPKIISLTAAGRPADPNAARVASIRVERGRTPGAPPAEAAAPASPVILSSRGAPL